MQSYEYLAVPAPGKGQKFKGLKTPADRYAHQLTLLLNELAAEGWEYWRADQLSSEERKGLTGTTRLTHDLLIFRRPTADVLAEQLQDQGHGQIHQQPQPDYSEPRVEPQLGRADGIYEDDSPRLTRGDQD